MFSLIHQKHFACPLQAGGVRRELRSLLLKDALTVEPQRDEHVTIPIPWTVLYLCSYLHSCVSLHRGYSQEALSAVIKGSHVGGSPCTWNLGPDGSQLQDLRQVIASQGSGAEWSSSPESVGLDGHLNNFIHVKCLSSCLPCSVSYFTK